MPLKDVVQPEILAISPGLRLRKYDGKYETLLPGYRDPVVYQNSEGIFDESRIPDLDYVQGMCAYLSRVGEMYYIEARENGAFVPVGDVTVKPENPPIAIWKGQYRGRGIGTLVMQRVIARLRELGYEKITGSTVYKWNTASQKMHEKLSFRRVKEDGDDLYYELELQEEKTMLLTVTLNTAIDKLYTVEKMTPGEVLRVQTVSATPGGKGLNVSKVAALAGSEVCAMGFVGGHNGDWLLLLLREANPAIRQNFTKTAAETRTCINIRDDSIHQHTEFLEPGAPVTREEYERFLADYTAALKEADAVTISGSMPKGVPMDCYATLIRLAKEKNVPVLLDTSGEVLRQGAAACPTLMKPNTDELAQLLGEPVSGEEQVLAALKELTARGVKYAVASLGSKGALAVGPEGAYRVTPPTIEPVNTVGCGDSMLAGLALMLAKHQPLEEGLRVATALGSANALSPKTGDFKQEDYDRLYPLVKIEKL